MMNRKKLYLKTVDLLLDAYNSGKLSHGDCTACAVGNICSNNDEWRYLFVTSGNTQHKQKPDLIKIRTTETGTIEIKNEELPNYIDKPGFVYFSYGSNDWYSYLSPPAYLANKSKGIELIESTGYTIEELAKVEYMFESSIATSKEGYSYYKNDNPKKGQFIGLSAVLDILAEIHGIRGLEEVSMKEEKQNKLEGIYNKFCIA